MSKQLLVTNRNEQFKKSGFFNIPKNNTTFIFATKKDKINQAKSNKNAFNIKSLLN